MIKALVLSCLLLLSGCGEKLVNTYNLPFIPDDYTNLYFIGQRDMCEIKPDSIFCVNSESVGDIQPTVDYAYSVVQALRANTKYEISDDWHYTDTVYEFQVRDCEDEAMTMINHMVEDGIDKKYLYLVYYITAEETETSAGSAHMFVGIMTDEGLMHMDVNTGIAPIEAQINWYMPMTDVGWYRKWIKGNIL